MTLRSTAESRPVRLGRTVQLAVDMIQYSVLGALRRQVPVLRIGLYASLVQQALYVRTEYRWLDWTLLSIY